MTAPPATDQTPRWPVLREITRQTLAVDRSAIAPATAVRCAIGVLVPLVVGLAIHQDIDGVVGVIGALSVGFASMRGTNRTRLAAALIAAVGMGISTVAAALCGGHAALQIPVTMAWGFGAGLAVCLGLSATVVALQCVVALLVVGDFASTASQAFERGGFVLAGGLIQVLLLAVTLPFGGYRSERSALAAAFAGLARHAGSLATGPELPLDPGLLTAAHIAVDDPQPLGQSDAVAAYQRLADEVDRIRLSLIALARAAIDAAAITTAAAAITTTAAAIDTLTAGSAILLSSLAEAIAAGRPPAPHEQVWASVHAAEKALTDQQQHLTRSDASPRARALLGQLRTCARLVSIAQGQSAPEPGLVDAISRPGRRRRWTRLLPVTEAGRTLRANLRPGSPAWRHAVRLSLALGVAVGLYRALPVPHGYWLPLTTLVVLKPDFTATFTRAASRIGGTLVGAAVATLVASLLHPDHLELTVLVGVFALIGYGVFRANYALYTICITSLVVFLVAFTGLPEVTEVGDRALDTVLGGTLALAAYLVWPTWQASLVPEALAGLLGRQADYVAAVLGCYIDPAGADRARLPALRGKAREARSAAQAGVARLRSEPERTAAALETATVERVLVASRGLVTAALALEAHLPSAAGEPLPELAGLQAVLPGAARLLAEAIAARRVADPAALPDLRALQVELTGRVLTPLASGQGPAAIDAALLRRESDLMVDSLDTIAELLAGTRPAAARRVRSRPADQPSPIP